MQGGPFAVAFDACVTFVASDCFLFVESLRSLKTNGDRGRPEGVVGQIRLHLGSVRHVFMHVFKHVMAKHFLHEPASIFFWMKS